MIKMAQLEHIRKLYHLEGKSIREISRITGHHRDTIAKYLNADSSDPPRYRLSKAKEHPVLGPYIPYKAVSGINRHVIFRNKGLQFSRSLSAV